MSSSAFDADYEISPRPAFQGSQGSIYFGKRKRDGYEIAVKVAAPSNAKKEMLTRESEILLALNQHPVRGVVECIELTEVFGRPALVMPRYNNDLGVWLQRLGNEAKPVDLDTILARGAELARTLAEVHDFRHDDGRIIHRDIKPENVFIDQKGRLHLGDFGCAMTIDGLRAVELALYGTPMWAPLDQVLPGRTIPDPTWDTYSLCMILYVAFTGERPAYQSDPREILTAEGRQLWKVARRAISAEGDTAKSLRRAFAESRVGATAADLIDVTGRAALLVSDRANLQKGLDRLADAACLTEGCRLTLMRGLWNLFSRGLSPVSHPSPPNRYRDALELADELEELRSLVETRVTPAPTSRLLERLNEGGVELPISDPPPRHAPEPLPVTLWLAVSLVAAVLVLGAVVLNSTTLQNLVAQIPEGKANDGGQTHIVPAFRIDRFETTAVDWNAFCSLHTGCSLTPADHYSASTITFDWAQKYCGSIGGSLPNRLQWLRAYTGATWPWGEEHPNCDHANALGCGDAPNGGEDHRSKSSSPDGVHDLVGNVWEWVDSGELLGGSVETPISKLGRSLSIPAGGPTPKYTGVRCVYPN